MEAYKAYSPQMETVENLDFLNEYKGRIWIIDTKHDGFYNSYFRNKEEYKLIEKEKFNTKYPSSFDTKYDGYYYNLILLEKIL